MNKNTEQKAILPIVSTSTRNAVETAIDFSKGKRSITWEKIAAQASSKISPWSEKKAISKRK